MNKMTHTVGLGDKTFHFVVGVGVGNFAGERALPSRPADKRSMKMGTFCML
jgi:hypothetical protein